jgi:lipoprotein-anchoring transpeptidase ErfK/SrfK
MNLILSAFLTAIVAASAGPATAAASSATPPANPATAQGAPAAQASGPLSLAVSTEKKILVVRLGATDVKKYDVAVGTSKKPTPMGRFGISHIVWNPSWHPPNEKWAKGKKAAGAGDPKNPMKVVKIFFQEPDYYIHGTDSEDSLGSAASHGCIRMAQADVYDLARYLMEHGGAPKSEEWFQSVMNTDKPAEVRLPKSVPIAIGK